MQKQTQILISGCGPVGLTLANILSKSALISSITLLDRSIPSSTRQLALLPNQRVYSINSPSLKLFDNLNVLNKIRNKGIMKQVQVVSKQSSSFTMWKQNQANIIENDELVYVLRNNLNEQENRHKIKFIQDEVSSLNINENFCEVKLKKSEETIETKLVVGSDGINSNIKKLSQIPHYGWQYRQKAIVCTMKINESFSNSTAYQVYHDGNVMALLPLWGSYVSLVWSLNLPDFNHLMSISEQQFKKKLNNVICNANITFKNNQTYLETPKILQIMNKRLSFPLSTMQSGYYTQQRVALIGDAAHTIHPMAGLGVNAGIMDSLLLANNIIKNLRSGHDIGDMISLGDFQAKAKVFNYTNSLAMQVIKKSFQTNNLIANNLRSFGMNVIHKSETLKRGMRGLVDGQNMKYEWDN